MARSDQPRFSIVIPAYNEANYLASTLSSLALQDYQGNYEVIVVDNNSTDETSSIAKAYGAKVVFEPVLGVCQARQTGTEHSRGEIIVSTDADTTFPKSWLSTIDQAFMRNPSCVAVAGRCTFLSPPWWGALYPKLLFNMVWLISVLTGRVFYITATNVSFKKEAWTGYDIRLTQGGDELDLLRRLRQRGKIIFLRRNSTFTSARRLEEGLLYNLTVTLFFYYILGYMFNRLFRRTLLRTAPAFRKGRSLSSGSGKFRLSLVLSGLCIIFIIVTSLGRELYTGVDITANALIRISSAIG